MTTLVNPLELLYKSGKKLAIVFNESECVYVAPEIFAKSLGKRGYCLIEDGCYDAFIDLRENKENYGWYRRYGLLYFKDGRPVLFQDGENWKEWDIENIPIHDKEKETNKGFYNLQYEYDEGEYKVYSCYLYDRITELKIKDFETEEIIWKS